MTFDIDSSSYVMMATGRMAEVFKPFANRVLGPLLVAGMRAMGIGTDWGFLLLQLVALSAFAFSVFRLLDCRNDKDVAKTFPLMLAPWIVQAAYDIYMPDMLTFALTALFLLMLKRGRSWLALALLPPMIMSRESSAVVGVCWLAAAAPGFKLNRKRGLIAAAMVAGFAAVTCLSRESKGNINGIGALYMPIKALVNGVFSITGLSPWNDVYARELPFFYLHEPLWKIACPDFLRVGRFTEIGIYEWHPFQVLKTLRNQLLGFGVLIPFALYKCRGQTFRSIIRAYAALPEWRRVAFASGFLFWALAPISGFSPARYIGYSWPLPWCMAIPLLTSMERRKYLLAVLFHALLLWGLAIHIKLP